MTERVEHPAGAYEMSRRASTNRAIDRFTAWMPEAERETARAELKARLNRVKARAKALRDQSGYTVLARQMKALEAKIDPLVIATPAHALGHPGRHRRPHRPRLNAMPCEAEDDCLAGYPLAFVAAIVRDLLPLLPPDMAERAAVNADRRKTVGEANGAAKTWASALWPAEPDPAA